MAIPRICYASSRYARADAVDRAAGRPGGHGGRRQAPATHRRALFAYPLHPPGQPDKLRDKHLPRICVPELFCSGTRDAFASPDELKAAASKVPNAKLHLLDGADHGFAVPKASGRTKEDVWQETAEVLLGWLRELE